MAAYVPPSLAVAVLALFPAVATRVGALAESLATRLVGKKRINPATAAAVAAVAGLLCYLLAIPFSFLGDSFLYLAEVIRAADSGQVDLFRYNSLLSSFIFLFLGSELMTLFGFVEVARVFWLITAVCGAIYTFVLLRSVHAVTEAAVDAAIFVGLILGLGGTILFFGYVEYYAPLFVATLAYAVSLYRAVTRNESLRRPAMLLALCVAFHFLALFYLPALLLAWYLRRKARRDEEVTTATFFRLVLAGVLLFVGVVTVVIVWQLRPLSDSLIPFSRQSWTGSYTMLSSYHLLDLLNEIMLVAAVPTALAVGLALAPSRRIAMDDIPTRVFFVFVLSLLLLTFVHFPFYAMARDWDIYAPLGIAIAFLVFAAMRSMRLEHALRKYLAGLIVVWSSAFLILWISTNINEASALRRYTHILQLDEHHVHEDFAQYGYSNLKKYFHHKGDEARSVQAFRRMIELRSYPWDINGFVNFVNAMAQPLSVREDIDAVRGLIMQKSRDSLLLSVHQGTGERDSSEYVIDQLFFLKPEISAAVLTRERIASFIAARPDLPQCRLLVYAIAPPVDRNDLIQYRSVYEESAAQSPDGKPLLSLRFRAGITSVIGQMYQQLAQADSARLWLARARALDSALTRSTHSR